MDERNEREEVEEVERGLALLTTLLMLLTNPEGFGSDELLKRHMLGHTADLITLGYAKLEEAKNSGWDTKRGEYKFTITDEGREYLARISKEMYDSLIVRIEKP